MKTLATSSSEGNSIVGMGGAVLNTGGNMPPGEPATYSVTLGARTEQNPYTVELAAMAIAMRCLPPFLREQQITFVLAIRLHY
jgi:hypothetical protein